MSGSMIAPPAARIEPDARGAGPLLALDRMTCARGGRLLFDQFMLTIAAGEAVHVTGANGCGKSSLLRLAGGLLAPASGTIERGSVALADEALALDRERTLGDALCFWGAEAGMAALGIERLAQVPVRLLSTGQARRARLARVVASEAALWLLDEPLNGLDKDGVALLGIAIARHRVVGGGVLAASHVALDGNWREVALT